MKPVTLTLEDVETMGLGELTDAALIRLRGHCVDQAEDDDDGGADLWWYQYRRICFVIEHRRMASKPVSGAK